MKKQFFFVLDARSLTDRQLRRLDELLPKGYRHRDKSIYLTTKQWFLCEKKLLKNAKRYKGLTVDLVSMSGDSPPVLELSGGELFSQEFNNLLFSIPRKTDFAID